MGLAVNNNYMGGDGGAVDGGSGEGEDEGNGEGGEGGNSVRFVDNGRVRSAPTDADPRGGGGGGGGGGSGGSSGGSSGGGGGGGGDSSGGGGGGGGGEALPWSALPEIVLVVDLLGDGWLSEVVLTLKETQLIKIEQSRYNKILKSQSPLDICLPLYRVE